VPHLPGYQKKMREWEKLRIMQNKFLLQWNQRVERDIEVVNKAQNVAL
jgi:hypothetical protein